MSRSEHFGKSGTHFAKINVIWVTDPQLSSDYWAIQRNDAYMVVIMSTTSCAAIEFANPLMRWPVTSGKGSQTAFAAVFTTNRKCVDYIHCKLIQTRVAHNLSADQTRGGRLKPLIQADLTSRVVTIGSDGCLEQIQTNHTLYLLNCLFI